MNGRHIVITGGAGALGRAVVALLADAGARCHVPLLHPTAPGAGVLPEGPEVEVTPDVDLTDEQQVAHYFAALPELWGSVHVVGGFTMAPLLDTSASDLRAMFDLNALSCFLSCREAVRAMRRSGAGGRIVNVAARPALEPTAGMVAYSTSKAAVAAMTQSLAQELSSEGILVNAVAPPIMDTPTNRAAMPDADWGRWPKVDEVAVAVRYLVAPDNLLTTGLVMPVYGRA